MGATELKNPESEYLTIHISEIVRDQERQDEEEYYYEEEEEVKEEQEGQSNYSGAFQMPETSMEDFFMKWANFNRLSG